MANNPSPALAIKVRALPRVEFDLADATPNAALLSGTKTPVVHLPEVAFDLSSPGFVIQHQGRKTAFQASDEFMSALELVLDLGIGCEVSIAREAQVDFERVNSLLRKHKMTELSRSESAAEGWDIQFELRPVAA